MENQKVTRRPAQSLLASTVDAESAGHALATDVVNDLAEERK